MNFRLTVRWLPGIVVWVVGLLSCNQSNQIQHINRYFDIPAFFSFRGDTLSRSDLRVEKKLFINGKEETITLNAADINWKKEFVLFAQCNLNKPALLDAYEIKETNAGNQQVLTYRLVKHNAPVIRVKILHQHEPDLTELEIITRHGSLMNIQETELRYSPRGYAVRKKITPQFFGKPSVLMVVARFIIQNP